MINWKKGCFYFCLYVGVFCFSAQAQISVVNDPNKASGSGEDLTAVGDTHGGLQQRVDLDADDAYLPTVLSMLSKLSGYNIVTGPEVNTQQRLSVHLKSTPVEEAINLIVRAVGLSYEVVGNSFLVTNREKLEKEVGLSTYFIQLQYAKATEMVPFLKDLTERVKIDSSRNALLISTSPKTISDIRGIIKQVDQPARQIVLRTRVIEVQVDKIKEMGIDWERLSKITTILAERPTGPNGVGRSATSSELGDPGLGELPSKQVFQQLDGLNNVGYFDRQLNAFDLTLDFLLQNNSATLLTDTKLATLNNRKASIHIGEVIPFIVRSQESARVERERVGILVEITPQINDDGYITAHVKPEASTIIEMINDEIPRTKIRTVETTVLVKDRQKIVIAGLLSNTENMKVHTVPFLGDIPFFGKIFQHLKSEASKTDLIIEITPYILNNQNIMEEMLRDSLIQEKDPIERLEELRAAALRRPKDSFDAEPTHLAYAPTAKVLKPFQYTVGFHEATLGCFNNFQLTFTPYEHIGWMHWGMKYSFTDELAFGIGWPREDFKNQNPGLWGRRLALYLVNNPVHSEWLDWNWHLDTRLGEYSTYGLGTSVNLKLGFVHTMLEVFETYTESPVNSDLHWAPSATGAVRLFWPWHKNLSITAGATVDTQVFNKEPLRFPNIQQDPWKETRLYFDLAYSGFFREEKRP